MNGTATSGETDSKPLTPQQLHTALKFLMESRLHEIETERIAPLERRIVELEKRLQQLESRSEKSNIYDSQ